MAYERHRYGKLSLADGGTITHGLGTTPTLVNVTPSTAGTVATVTAVSATTITVALKAYSYSLNTLSLVAAATQTVYWEAAS